MAKVPDNVPEQQTSVVVQLLAERANAVTYGNEPRVEQIDRQLAEYGVAAEKRKAASKDEGRSSSPQGRSSRRQESTDK